MNPFSYPIPVVSSAAVDSTTGYKPKSLRDECAPHAYVGAFNCRLERGRWSYTPCLGWKEFVPDHVGPFRDGTAPCAT